MLINLTLGDWAQNGNCTHEDYIYESNYPVERLAEAYETSCRKYGVQFNNAGHDFVGYGSDVNENWRYIWNRYDETGIDPVAYVTLEQAGILTEEDVFRMHGSGDYYVEDKAGLVLRFIALSMPEDFDYKPVDIPSLNAVLHSNIGYGLSAV